MKLYNQKRNKHKYVYAHDTLYINKRKTETVVKYFGPVKEMTPEIIELKKAEFQEEVAERETRKRIEYWKERSTSEFFSKNIIEKMERLRSKLYRAKREMGGQAKAALDVAFMIDFIYNSNKIEGSRMPRSRVKELFKEGRGSPNEVSNTLSAKEYVDKTFKFTTKQLVKMHSMLLSDEPSKHGLRKGPMIVGDDATLPEADNVPRLLDNLFKWYRDNEYKLYPVQLAFDFYYKFERIHPFEDGNGRMGRLLMNKILKNARYHPIIIWNKQRQAQFTAFKRTLDDKHMPPYYRFMNEQYKKTHNTYIAKIKPAEDLQNLIEIFLSPSE